MTIKIIKTEEEYQQALERLEYVFNAKKGTAEGDELEVLSMLIEQYENQNFPIDFPDPIEAIKFRMDQLGYKQKDLALAIGFKGHISEILNKKKKLTLGMIRKLHENLSIPSDVLLREY